MTPCLCKRHFRQVANTFDKETALAYGQNDAECVICNKVIFLEAARRFIHSQPPSVDSLSLPEALARLSS